MLQHAKVIGATVGQSSQIGVQVPDEGDDEDEQARGASLLRAVWRQFSF